MADDDFDLDLDTEPLEPEPRKRGVAPPPGATPVAGPPAEQQSRSAGAAAGEATAPAQQERPRAPTVARKPGFFARLTAPLTQALARLRIPAWNMRNFLLGLLALVVLAVVLDNWPPMRLNFLIGHVDIPKAVVLVVDFGLGLLVGFLLFRRRREVANQ